MKYQKKIVSGYRTFTVGEIIAMTKKVMAKIESIKIVPRNRRNSIEAKARREKQGAVNKAKQKGAR